MEIGHRRQSNLTQLSVTFLDQRPTLAHYTPPSPTQDNCGDSAPTVANCSQIGQLFKLWKNDKEDVKYYGLFTLYLVITLLRK